MSKKRITGTRGNRTEAQVAHQVALGKKQIGRRVLKDLDGDDYSTQMMMMITMMMMMIMMITMMMMMMVMMMTS